MRQVAFVILGLIAGSLLVACDVLSSTPPPTPLVITATPEFIIVTSTPTPSASPVLAPTIALPEGPAASEAAIQASATLQAQATLPITATPTFTPTPTDTPPTPGAAIGLVGGVPAAENVALPATCSAVPAGGFGLIFQSNQDLATRLGCPSGGENASNVTTAYQTYQGGAMIWVSSVGNLGSSAIYVLYNDGTYQRFPDTWQSGVDPDSTGLAAPEGLQEPIRGFGKVWREMPGVRDRLGWATSGERGDAGGYSLALQGGEMIYAPQSGQTYIMLAGGNIWQSVPQPY